MEAQIYFPLNIIKHITIIVQITGNKNENPKWTCQNCVQGVNI